MVKWLYVTLNRLSFNESYCTEANRLLKLNGAGGRANRCHIVFYKEEIDLNNKSIHFLSDECRSLVL
jgi:hypothetical protein